MFMWNDLPHKDPGAIAPTSMDAADNLECFEKYRMHPSEGKGEYGVRVRENVPQAYLVNSRLPAGTFVGAYPGRVYTAETWENAAKKDKGIGRSSKMRVSQDYAMEFFHYSKEDGGVIGNLIIDPSDASVLRVADEFAHHLTPFINEPSG